MARMSFQDSVKWIFSFTVAVILVAGNVSANKEGYYGKYIGKLSQLHHGVSGDVFAVDGRTLHLRNFNYDGEGPAAYFYAGNSKAPGVNGFRLRDERGTTNVLPRYRNKHITITLPEGKTLQNIRWFSVWCDEFSVNFGDVKIPKNLDFPKPQKISGLSGVHGVSSEPIVIVDAQTLLIPSFSYDGEAPDAKFWVGQGFKPSPQGIRIPDENGKILPLRRYDRKTIVLTLPGDLTIFDIGHFGVWCEAFTVDFGHVQIPRGLSIPPSLKMLGVSPQKRSPSVALPLAVQNGFENPFGSQQTDQPRSKLNCEVLWDDFAYEVRWAVAGDSIVLQLVARLENNEYMSFGLSGDYKRSRMVGGDVVVAWVDKESLKGYAQDYYLDAKSQCSGGRGSCPDENIALGTNSVRLLNAALVNGYSIVTLQRSLKAQDEFDKQVFTNESQPIIWAIGPLNSRKEVSYHSLTSRGDIFIDFGRSPKWNCPTPESAEDQSDSKESLSTYRSEAKEGTLQDTRKQDSGRVQSRQKIQIPTPAPASTVGAWEIPPIKCYEPEDGVFYAQMGPTGGKHGYSAITGHVGWGTSWYINGLLIPEINVVRGRTYTFIVEGGLNPEIPARYHPFYITDDPVGGYQYKTPEERANIQIFAGAVQNKKGEVRPTGVGRWCNWTPDPNQPPADEFLSFGAYQRTLRLECDPGNPGIIQWTVDKDTPDTVYYQCYTHRYLGWKINVHDHCEGEGASEPVPSIVKAPSHFINSHETDFEGSESINYETKIKPNYGLFKNAFEKNQTKFEFNEFVNHKTDVKYYPQVETNKREPESPIPGEFLTTMWKNEMGLKNPYLKPQELDELNSRSPQAFIYDSSVSAVQLPLSNIPRVSLFTDNKFIKYSQASQLPATAWTDGKGAVYVNFHGEPAPIFPQGSQIELAYVDGGLKSGSEKEEALINQAAPLIVQPLQKNKNPISVEEFRKNYHGLGAQAEEKFKKTNQKLPFPTKLFNNPQHNGQHFSRLRKPSPFHALPLQQRPFPPEEFRPPSNKQPLTSTSQKIFHYTQTGKSPRPHHRIHPNVRYEPKEIYKQEIQKNYQFSIHPQGNKKKQESAFKQDFSSALVSSGPSTREQLSVYNSGFDPESVKIEGGFKPILNTPVSKFNNLIDRLDQNIEDVTEVSDLINHRGSDENRVLTRQEQTETDVNKRDINQQEPPEGEEIDLFKNQKLQMFEPIFIPSFPDDSLKKHQDKYKKAVVSLKHRNNELQNRNSHKNDEIYVKFRPTQNLVRRPFYPDNIIPPFKIPYRGGFPQLRHHETENSGEKNGTFDIIKMNNETLSRNDSRAENILEVIEMQKDENQDSATVSDSSTNVYIKNENRSQLEEDVVIEDEIAMADDSRDYYLPPKSDKFLTYDGKLVKAELPPTILDATPTADVSKLPQFVPFKGTIPPLSLKVNTKNLPQLNSRNYARQDILPPTETKSTKLSAVQSEQQGTTVPATQESILKDLLDLKEYETEERKESRRKRSPDHIPGHMGHDHHGHEHHHHDVFSRSSSSININNLLHAILIGIIALSTLNNL